MVEWMDSGQNRVDRELTADSNWTRSIKRQKFRVFLSHLEPGHDPLPAMADAVDGFRMIRVSGHSGSRETPRDEQTRTSRLGFGSHTCEGSKQVFKYIDLNACGTLNQWISHVTYID